MLSASIHHFKGAAHVFFPNEATGEKSPIPKDKMHSYVVAIYIVIFAEFSLS